jgi:hypothetical protein
MLNKINLPIWQKLMFGGMLILFNLVFLSEVKAQYRCDKLGYSAPPREVRVNGVWKIEHANNSGLLHTTILTMKGWGGVSITSFYDSRENRTRNISQNHLLCMKGKVMVVLGFAPFDSDTGEKVTTYGADNFYLIKNEKGNLDGINIDDTPDKPNISRLKVIFLSGLGN